MNLIPIQFSDLKIGQPLSWDLFDQERKPLMERGYIIKTTDELEELSKKSSVLLRLKASSEKLVLLIRRFLSLTLMICNLKLVTGCNSNCTQVQKARVVQIMVVTVWQQ